MSDASNPVGRTAGIPPVSEGGATPTVGTHPQEARELALQASYRIEAMADALRRELEHEGCGFAATRLIRDVLQLNSVVMSCLGDDRLAPLSDLAEIVGVEVRHG